MRTRTVIALLLLALGLVATGCFESDSGGTVSGPVTLGTPDDQTVVDPNGSEATSTESEATSTESESTATETETEPPETSTTEGGGEDFTAAKASFVSTCGGCHALSDAGTSGAVGPDLSTIALNSSDIEKQIENGGGGMPPGLLQGDEAKAVADYVASVDGS